MVAKFSARAKNNFTFNSLLNTPIHGIINLIVLDHGKGSKSLTLPIALGAIMPEAPILLYYFIQKFILSKPEALIWTLIHDRPAWQLSVDITNSIPLVGIVLIIAFWIKNAWLIAFFASMGLHLLCDLPLLGKQALNQLLPFNHSQFEHCISYHQVITGNIWFHLGEIALLIVAGFYLNRKKTNSTRIAGNLFIAAYAIAMLYAWTS